MTTTGVRTKGTDASQNTYGNTSDEGSAINPQAQALANGIAGKDNAGLADSLASKLSDAIEGLAPDKAKEKLDQLGQKLKQLSPEDLEDVASSELPIEQAVNQKLLAMAGGPPAAQEGQGTDQGQQQGAGQGQGAGNGGGVNGGNGPTGTGNGGGVQNIIDLLKAYDEEAAEKIKKSLDKIQDPAKKEKVAKAIANEVAQSADPAKTVADIGKLSPEQMEAGAAAPPGQFVAAATTPTAPPQAA